MKRMAWVVVAAVLGTGCSGGSSTSSSSGGSVTPLTPSEAMVLYFQKNCEYIERCAAIRGRSYSTLAACTSLVSEADAFLKALYGVTYSEAQDRDFTVGDDATFRRCADKFTTYTCEDVRRVDEECDALFVPKHPVANGAVCTGPDAVHEPRCANDSQCTAATGNPACSTCMARKADGQACTSGDECTSRFCGGSTGTCGPAAPKTKGQACNRTNECLGELVCAGSPSVCTERGGVGGACDPSGGMGLPGCMQDLHCIKGASGTMGTCTAPIADGQPCSRAAGTPDCKHQCVFTSGDAATGSCGPFTSLPAGGQPCSRFQAGYAATCTLDETIYADFVLSANFDSTVSCTCRSKVAMGQPCFFNSGCTNGRCQGSNILVTPYTAGVCAALTANGGACSTNTDCASERCTGTTNKTCAPALTCP
jgi:hypothetical protein